MQPTGPNRRDLFRTGATGALAMTAGSYSRILGANDRLRLGVIGCGGRGYYVMQKFQGSGTVDVTALCDVYAARVDRSQQKAPNAKGYSDHRKMLEQKDIDIVQVTTPDHWHALITIDALNAGKDVYVEKPLTLKIEEGPKIVRAARVNNRVCQVGTQRRSGAIYHRAKEEFFNGKNKLGKITLVRTWWHNNGAHLKEAPAELATQPTNLDWARYLGPVKWHEWDPRRYWNFRAYLEFGGGQITDLFTHWIDAVHMLLDEDDPISATAAGGVYNYKDGRTAPDTICAALEYRNEWTATFEGTLVPGIKGTAAELCGTQGRLKFVGNSYEYTPAGKGAQTQVVKLQDDQVRNHVGNFLDCVRTRKRPNADVYIGHRSAQASHLANIAYVQKRRIRFDPDREEILPF